MGLLDQKESVWFTVNMFLILKALFVIKGIRFMVITSLMLPRSEALDAAHSLYFFHDLPGKTPFITIAGVCMIFDIKTIK